MAGRNAYHVPLSEGIKKAKDFRDRYLNDSSVEAVIGISAGQAPLEHLLAHTCIRRRKDMQVVSNY